MRNSHRTSIPAPSQPMTISVHRKDTTLNLYRNYNAELVNKCDAQCNKLLTLNKAIAPVFKIPELFEFVDDEAGNKVNKHGIDIFKIDKAGKEIVDLVSRSRGKLHTIYIQITASYMYNGGAYVDDMEIHSLYLKWTDEYITKLTDSLEIIQNCINDAKFLKKDIDLGVDHIRSNITVFRTFLNDMLK